MTLDLTFLNEFLKGQVRPSDESGDYFRKKRLAAQQEKLDFKLICSKFFLSLSYQSYRTRLQYN